LIGDILPAGVLNIVTGFGAEAGQALATSKRIAKLSFTGSTETGRKYITTQHYSCNYGIRWKISNIFFHL
jgi:acyl-CoA reductase-like NAD-dependent aldehyde dehydrogenase